MDTIRFLGKIYPEVVNLTINFRPTIEWQSENLNGKAKFTCKIDNSVIDVQCDVEKYDPNEFVKLYIRAIDIARAQIDLAALKQGYGLTVLLDEFVDNNQIKTKLLMKDENLRGLISAFSLDDSSYDQICSHVLSSPPLFMTIRELVESITLPHVSVVNCTRALERIRNIIADENEIASRTKAWEAFRSKLNLSENYIKFITEHSKEPRHGKQGHVPENITTEITKRTWTIINRYFEFLKNKKCKLNEKLHPIL